MKRFLLILAVLSLLVAGVAYAATYSNITSATTTVISSRPVMLSHVMVNGGVMGTITIYDSGAASGTKIATITPASAGETYVYLSQTITGLTVVTAAATDITVVTQ